MVSRLETPVYGVVAVFAPEDLIVDEAAISKTANQLMNLKGNHVCFVAAHISAKKVKVSARSDGSVNVQLLMEKLGGGGGHFAMAAGIFENSSIEEVKDAIYNVINKHLSEATADAAARKFEGIAEE